MSEELVERIRKGYAAFNRGDFDAAVEDFHPDIDWIAWDALPDGGTLRGRDAVREFFKTWHEAFDQIRVEVEELIDAGDQVVAVTCVRGRGGGSTAEVVSPIVPWVWTIRNGQVIRMEMFANKEEALETLGLLKHDDRG